MVFHFVKYFVTYIFFNKTRQRLLFIALFGLFLSSFSLIILQSIMGGLQNGVIKRARDIQGSYQVQFLSDEVDLNQLKTQLVEEKFPFTLEYEIELLIKNHDYLSPMVLHGVDSVSRLPNFLQDYKMGDGIHLGSELASKIKGNLFTDIMVISPAHTNDLLGEIPRQSTIELSNIVTTNVYEVDSFHAWVRSGFVHNLIRRHDYNRLRIFADNEEVTAFLDKIKAKPGYKILTWNDSNTSLVWALNLENVVMLSLFVGMSFLIAISITSGFMIFFDKIKNDLISFWIMGLTLKRIRFLAGSFLVVVSSSISLFGLLSGLVFLKVLDHSSLNLMPDVFLEQNLPVLITNKGILISFLVPYLICLVFSFLSLRSVKNDNQSFLQMLRQSGH